MNKSQFITLLFVGAASTICASGRAEQHAPESVVTIAEAEYATIREHMCPPPGAPEPDYAALFDTEKQRMEPVKVFDNLYFIGMKTVSAWALTTSEGIILIDAMFHYNVEQTVVDGLRKLGFDPAAIKYVIVTHGHNDHFGGAKYLQDTYGARIVLSEADWDYLETWPQLGSPAPLPKRDVVARDGDQITLGDATVEIVITPGHTPGTISPLFTVREGNQQHRIAYWGGAAVGFLPPEAIAQYIESARNYAKLDPRVDVELSNHPFVDGSLLKLDALSRRRPGEPHPFVTGNQGFKRWMEVIEACAGVVMARKTQAVSTQ
jgi:metallo-beta-lactamase class B